MMDDIQEQTELADEISRAISEPAGFGMDVDEVSRIFLQCFLPLQKKKKVQWNPVKYDHQWPIKCGSKLMGWMY